MDRTTTEDRGPQSVDCPDLSASLRKSSGVCSGFRTGLALRRKALAVTAFEASAIIAALPATCKTASYRVDHLTQRRDALLGQAWEVVA